MAGCTFVANVGEFGTPQSINMPVFGCRSLYKMPAFGCGSRHVQALLYDVCLPLFSVLMVPEVSDRKKSDFQAQNSIRSNPYVNDVLGQIHYFNETPVCRCSNAIGPSCVTIDALWYQC
jgi:hypothetical protein